MKSDLPAHTSPHAGEYKGSDIQEDPAPVVALFGLSILRHGSTGSPTGLRTTQAQGTAGSRLRKFRDVFIPQFVELVETNPDVTSALALHPRPFDPPT